ncbi:MAG TPA: adenylosuccinate lyase [Acidimicrobiia bacterium]|nr:adenylosuccinate lyase [Acidimicrobiia bacterium]
MGKSISGAIIAVVIERYTLPEMGRIWSEQRKLEVWKEVETLALEAWNALGRVPDGVAEATRAASCPTPEEVAERERVTNHDLAAFVDLLGEAAGPDAAAWVHFGLTSSDVLDTAGGVVLTEAADLLLAALEGLFSIVKQRALEHQGTHMIGRTHGIWAEPTLFGHKLAGWAFELARDHTRLMAARETVAVGKISGAVGTYAHIPPEVEARVCAALGLGIEPVSTQVTARDRHAQYLQTIALIGASIERMATEIRHLQRSEVSEVREQFGSGQKGSSAMPHKRNPILSERMTGIARLLRGYSQVGLEDVALWHERDISHSSAERVVLPDASIALHYMLVKFTDLIANLVVDAERMSANLEATRGLVFSQAVLLALVETGMTRDQAYRIVQRHSMVAWSEARELRDLLASDPEVPLGGDALEACFSLQRVIESTRPVFDRLRGLELEPDL